MVIEEGSDFRVLQGEPVSAITCFNSLEKEGHRLLWRIRPNREGRVYLHEEGSALKGERQTR